MRQLAALMAACALLTTAACAVEDEDGTPLAYDEASPKGDGAGWHVVALLHSQKLTFDVHGAGAATVVTNVVSADHDRVQIDADAVMVQQDRPMNVNISDLGGRLMFAWGAHCDDPRLDACSHQAITAAACRPGFWEYHYNVDPQNRTITVAGFGQTVTYGFDACGIPAGVNPVFHFYAVPNPATTGITGDAQIRAVLL
jgi:hypothetical protein